MGREEDRGMNCLPERYLDRRPTDSSFSSCAFHLSNGLPQNQFTSGSAVDQTQVVNRGKSSAKSDVTDDVEQHKTREETTRRMVCPPDGDVTSPIAGSLADCSTLRETPSCAQNPSSFGDSANEPSKEQRAATATPALAETAGHVRDSGFLECSVGSRTPELASAKVLDLTPLQEQLRACIAASYLGPEEDFDTGYDFADADMSRFGFCSALSDVPSFFQSELI